ncbi:hypothetical protein [Neorhodopirellula lusitana]|uniref:hypothetical protein n=1 Tax=Neorhodopirellula lusitana TaxID=445327 RepID=UPI00384E9329
MTTWDSYRHRRKVFWILILTYLPGVALAAIAMQRWTGSDDAAMIAAVAWMAAYGVAGWRCGHFPCPQCGRPFFIWRFTYHVWTGQCLHCNLPKWADPSTRDIAAPSAIDSDDDLECPLCHQAIQADEDTCGHCGWSYFVRGG